MGLAKMAQLPTTPKNIKMCLCVCVCVCVSVSQDKVHQFCSRSCCEDYKKLHCIVTFCENCQEEKTLHDTLNISGVKRPFCSEGTRLSVPPSVRPFVCLPQISSSFYLKITMRTQISSYCKLKITMRTQISSYSKLKITMRTQISSYCNLKDDD